MTGVQTCALPICSCSLRAAAVWPAPLRLSLNVTPADLASWSFAADLGETLRLSGFPADRLTLEVTEQVLLADVQLAARALADADAEIDSALVILDLVNRSDWMTVAPCLIATPDGQDRLRLVPLRQPALIFKVVLLQPAAAVLPPGAAEFLDILRREAEENVSGWSNNYSTLGGS